ncbi:MAG: LEPR-XLL domain-containing protein, partial [bacterium]
MGNDKSDFLLEMLEPRILLSGNGIQRPVAVSAFKAVDFFLEIKEDELGHRARASDQAGAYHPEEGLSDLFSDLDQQASSDQWDASDAAEETSAEEPSLKPYPDNTSPSNTKRFDQRLKASALPAQAASVLLPSEDTNNQETDTSTDELPTTSSEGASSITEERVATLNVANPPPAGEGVTLTFAAGPETTDLTLRLHADDPDVLEIYDNAIGTVCASGSLAHTIGVRVIGSPDTTSTFTIDFAIPFWLDQGISIEGGIGFGDILSLQGDGCVSADYAATGADTGSIELSIENASTVITFGGIEPVYINAAAQCSYTILTNSTSSENSTIDESSQDSDPVSQGDTIVVEQLLPLVSQISVTSAGTPLSPVFISQAQAITIDAGANDTESADADTVSIEANGLGACTAFTILTGEGDDAITIDTAGASLPKQGSWRIVAGGGDDRVVLNVPVCIRLTIDGGPGRDMIIGADADTTWTITGINAGIVGRAAFAQVEDLAGGAGEDTFVFTDAGKVSGLIDGGAGLNTLDYTACAEGILADLSCGSATCTGGIRNIQRIIGPEGDYTAPASFDEGTIGPDNGAEEGDMAPGEQDSSVASEPDDALSITPDQGGTSGTGQSDAASGVTDEDAPAGNGAATTTTGSGAGEGAPFYEMGVEDSETDPTRDITVEDLSKGCVLKAYGPCSFHDCDMCCGSIFDAAIPDSLVVASAGMAIAEIHRDDEVSELVEIEDTDPTWREVTFDTRNTSGDGTSGSVPLPVAGSGGSCKEGLPGSGNGGGQAQAEEEQAGQGSACADQLDSSAPYATDRLDYDSREEQVFHGHDPPAVSVSTPPLHLTEISSPSSVLNAPSGIPNSDTSSPLLEQTEPIIREKTQFIANQPGDDLAVNGVYSPGNSPGVDTVATLTLGPTDTLLIEIGGTTPGTGDSFHDQTIVTGLATLDGTLDIDLWNGFEPAVGDSFEILTYGSVTAGDFAGFVDLDLGNGLEFVPVKGTSSYFLYVVPTGIGVSDIQSHFQDLRDDWLDTFNDAAVFAQAIPFVGQEVGDLIDLGIAYGNEVLDQLNFGIYDTIANFIEAFRSSGLLPDGLDITYDSAERVLTIPVEFSHDFAPVEDLAVDLGDFSSELVSIEASLTADLDVAVYGRFDLVVDLSGPAAWLMDQVSMAAEMNLTITDPTVEAQFGFVGVTLGGTGSSVTLDVTATAALPADSDPMTTGDQMWSFTDLTAGTLLGDFDLDLAGDASALLRGIEVDAGISGIPALDLAEVSITVPDLASPTDLDIDIDGLDWDFYRYLHVDDIGALLHQAGDFILDAMDRLPFFVSDALSPYADFEIPLINRSPREILSIVDQIGDAIDT